MQRVRQLLDAHGVDIALLLLRLWFGLVLAFAHGWGKFTNFEKFSGYVAKQGFWLPELSAAFAVAGELLAGCLIALGIFVRPAALVMALTMLSAALIVHWGDPFAKIEFAMAYAVAAIAFCFSGPGRLSLSYWWLSRKTSRAS